MSWSQISLCKNMLLWESHWWIFKHYSVEIRTISYLISLTCWKPSKTWIIIISVTYPNIYNYHFNSRVKYEAIHNWIIIIKIITRIFISKCQKTIFSANTTPNKQTPYRYYYRRLRHLWFKDGIKPWAGTHVCGNPNVWVVGSQK